MSNESKMILRRAAWGLVGAGALGVVVLGALNPGNIARTSRENADPRLRTRYYSGTLQDVNSIARAIIPTLKTYGRSWRLVEDATGEKSEDGSRLTIRAAVPVTLFTDDLTVTIEDTGQNIAVDVYSQSRVGKGDFGENRRHIIQFLTELDRQWGIAAG